MQISTLRAEEVFDDADFAIDAALDIDVHNEKSPYNYFGYKPVRQELSQIESRITGTLPADLQGVYLRNGTNTQFDNSRARLHCFNGAGMLHQIQIRDGRAFYSNTYIRTPVYEIEKQVGREAFVSYSDIAGGGKAGLDKVRLVEAKKRTGRLPAISPLETVQSSTAVQFHHGKIYCLNEAGYPFVLDARRVNGMLALDGTGHFETWGGDLKSAFSAHPRIDPVSGDFYSLTIDRMASAVNATQLSGGKLVNQATVYRESPEQGHMAYLHDYFLTEHFLIFPDISMRFAPNWILEDGGSFFRYDPNHKLRWGVVSRDLKSETRWFEAHKAGSIWHMVNAWERVGPNGDELVLFAPLFHEYPCTLPIHTPEEPPAKLNKWVLNLASGQVTEDKVLLQHGHERPSLNVAYVGKENRYAYLLDEERDGYMGKGVLKYDLLAEKEVKYFDYGDFYGGEALFVPRVGATAEDDGYLLELLMAQEEAQLIVIDARTMNELARVHLPQRVPFGVHACWLDEEKLNALTA